MSLLIYFFIGIIATFFGALPLGTVNISVINTTIKENMNTAMKIAFAAGFAEIILSFYALHCSMAVTGFISTNDWLQITLTVLVLCFGVFMLLKKQKEVSEQKKSAFNSKYLSGFILGLINPPVLLYWIFVIEFLNRNNYSLTMSDSLTLVFLFFAGVYLGKVLTLYLYGKSSMLIKNKFANISKTVNKFIGILLIAIAAIQFIRLFLG
ncbi:LysE family transporter [Leptobacterium flavescens]|uniref:LysE family transporter n=1 Tax=Leptobacterium flavescens TaxID=472055 RepID=A0A6P0UH08_9FLAO|nr:LysE family transporter [Leptobacterium flavescens]NER12591.1 LysE family transporter [Leptobacterium flavescens]